MKRILVEVTVGVVLLAGGLTAGYFMRPVKTSTVIEVSDRSTESQTYYGKEAVFTSVAQTPTVKTVTKWYPTPNGMAVEQSKEVGPGTVTQSSSTVETGGTKIVEKVVTKTETVTVPKIQMPRLMLGAGAGVAATPHWDGGPRFDNLKPEVQLSVSLRTWGAWWLTANLSANLDQARGMLLIQRSF